MRYLLNLQKIDRRIMYLLLAVVVIIPLKTGKPDMPLPVMSEVQGAYDTIQNIPPGKIALVSITWNAGTKAENQIEMESLVRHFFQKRVPFVLMPWDPQGDKLAEDAVKAIAKETGRKYGEDWINIGFRPLILQPMIQAMAVNLPGWIGKDMYGVDVRKYPMFQNVRSLKDVGLLVETTGSGTVADWISFASQPYRIPLVYGPTSVMVPEGYNYVDTKQVAGMLPGLVGAAQYDELVNHKGAARRGANALSLAHMLIIVLIILGNIGYYFARREAARE